MHGQYTSFQLFRMDDRVRSEKNCDYGVIPCESMRLAGIIENEYFYDARLHVKYSSETDVS
jgi:hypothetical protein